MVHKPKKAKNVLESWKMANEKEAVQNGAWVRRLKLVHCIQLTIAEMKVFPIQLLFWSMIVCLFTVTVLHKSYEILLLCIFHKSTFQTLLLQLSGLSIWKINPSLKESSLEFWCNVTLHNCMSLKKQTSCISYCNWSTGIGMKWNTSTDLSVLSSSISTV